MASPPGFASHLTDTIVAVGSPPGGGARAIVRLSGGQSFPILAALFHPAQERESALLRSPLPYSVLAGEAEFPGWGVGLPALAYLMPAPRSYTREDVAELHLVGSPPVVMAVLEACVEGGARLAEPGEFTRRALVAGRLDLAQAEALLKLVDAPDEATARAAVRELTGWLGNRLNGLAQRLFQLVTQVEATIDFSQEDIQLVTPAEAAAAVEQVQSDVEALLADARKGLVEQLPTVLLFGPANVGKSSLFNRLVGRTTALVTSVPGTTRDAVEAIVPLGDIRLRLLDGAGQWEGFTGLDARAAERTRALLARADLVLHLIDTRLSAKRITCYTSNIPVDQIAQVYDDSGSYVVTDPEKWLRSYLTKHRLQTEGLPSNLLDIVLANLSSPDVTPGGKLATLVDAMTIAASACSNMYTADKVEKAASRLMRFGWLAAQKTNGVL